MPGARSARSLVCKVENTRVSHHGHAGIARHSPRNGFNGSFVLSPVIGFFVTVAPKKLASQGLDAGVEASGPHDFTVRSQRSRQQRRLRPPHPLPYVRDDRETPLCVGRDGERYRSDLGPMGSKISEIPK